MICVPFLAGAQGEEGFFRPPPHGLRHPQIFYYGHAPCLYVNKLRVAGVLDGPVDPYLESILEVRVGEVAAKSLSRVPSPSPLPVYLPPSPVPA